MYDQTCLPYTEYFSDNTGEKQSFSDPAFAGNKTQPIHRWVPWIAGFSSAFVKDSLSKYLHGRKTVLDPFAGVGTTLVEAMLAGHNSIGFEINPYAVLASRTKTNAYQIDLNSLGEKIKGFQLFYSKSLSEDYEPHSIPPEGFRTRAEFYSPEVLHKVLVVQDYISNISCPLLKDVFYLAFASTMVRYSNYSYEPSLGRRTSSGKKNIIDFPVGETITSKLYEILEDIKWARKNQPFDSPSVTLINDTFFNYEKHLASESIDFAVTSPPYLNNYHYIRNTRPQLFWLGLISKSSELKHLETSNFGTYWQTVRELPELDLEFSLPDSDLIQRIDTLKAINKDRGVYGGQGWANYAVTYFNDCYKLALGLNFSLKHGATALVVLGNSILQGILIPTDRYFGQICELVGLECVKIHVPRSTRVGNSIINSDIRVGKAKKNAQLYEAVVEVRKS